MRVYCGADSVRWHFAFSACRGPRPAWSNVREECAVVMTVGMLKEWLGSISSNGDLSLPDGLPDELGDLKNAVNIKALTDWFTIGDSLTDVDPDAGNLCLRGAVAPNAPLVSLRFFADDDSDSVADGVEIVGVRIALSLKDHPVMSILSGIGLQDLRLVYKIGMLDGAAVREVYAQAELPTQGGESLLITSVLGFNAWQKSFEFIVEPGSGKEGNLLEEFFGLFDADLPPFLKDVIVERLVLAYDRGAASSGFRVEVDTRLQLGDITADLDVKVALTKRSDGQGYAQEYTARLVLEAPAQGGDEGERIRLGFLGAIGNPSKGVWELSAAMENSGEELTLSHLAAAVGVEVPSDLAPFVPAFHSASCTYRFPTVPSAPGWLVVSVAVGRVGVVVASVPTEGQGPTTAARLVAVRGEVGARMSDLPLVGEAIPPAGDVVVTGVQFLYADSAWPAARVQALNALLRGLPGANEGLLPVPPAEPLVRGLLVWASLTIGGKALAPLVVRPNGTGASPPPPPPRPLSRPDAPASPDASGDAVVLGRERAAAGQERSDSAQQLDQASGPVRISQVSLGYANGWLTVAFDAVMTLGPVQLVLLGLGLAIDGELNVEPRLRGAGVQLDKPPLRISGMVERRTGSEIAPGLKEQFVGLASVETGFFALRAAGSYAKAKDGWSSMFLFGEISGGERGLFGPPPFRVVGISLGFGVNSTVRTPTIAQVSQFPLVHRLDGSGSGETPEQVLAKLAGPGGWITPREGQYWGAGGIEFSSFEFIRSRALLLVEGGESWKVLLIGRTTIDLPRNRSADKQPIARLVIDLAIGYHHDQGLFSMDAVIAPGSYVIDPAAELTGGLSLYIWGKDRTAQGGGKGFVFTLGGYHPRFKRPAYYPNPPRVGWRWQRGPVTIRGQVYAALTDGAFMAGGELSASYDQGHGIQLQAWFTAWLDALVQWKPFYFDLSMGLNIGVAATVKVLFVRVRISLEVGVSLDLWGPPIGGRAKVKIWFITFTINFGNSRDGAPAIEWPEFRVQLPAPLSLTPLWGLLADVDPEETAARSAAGEPVLVSCEGFAVRTEAAVPASRIIYNDEPLPGAEGSPIDIRPMGLREVVSEHHVTLTSDIGASLADWRVAAYRQDMPKAMWGAPLRKPADVLDGDGLLSNCLAGVTFEIPRPELAPSVGRVDAEALKADKRPDAPIPLLGSEEEGAASVVDERSIAAIVAPGTGIAAEATAAARSSVHAALAGLGLAPGTDDPLTRYAELAQTTFTNPPMTTAAER
ncbi:DUF6603 domain-containing protein [Streptomyces tubercidicus]|nr:DUF6603 domain-containing protein [Streptomyces tubercidicus]